jgi:hypothetical protein
MEGSLMITTHIDINGNVTSIDDGINLEAVQLSPEMVAIQAIAAEITSRISTATTIAQLRNGITAGLAAAVTQLEAQ